MFFIFHIEDHLGLARACERCFHSIGVPYVNVRTVKDAVAFIEDRLRLGFALPNVVLLDLDLGHGKKEGLEFLEYRRAAQLELRVIVLSGYLDSEMQRLVQDYGAQLMDKPANGNELTKFVMSSAPPGLVYKHVGTVLRSVEAPLPERLAETEKEIVLATYEEHGRNKTRAAEALGITRPTMQRKLAEIEVSSGEPGGVCAWARV